MAFPIKELKLLLREDSGSEADLRRFRGIVASYDMACTAMVWIEVRSEKLVVQGGSTGFLTVCIQARS